MTMIERRTSEVEELLRLQQPLEHTPDELRPAWQLLASQYVEDDRWSLFKESAEATIAVHKLVEEAVVYAPGVQREPYSDMLGAMRFDCVLAKRVAKLPRFVHGLYGHLGPEWRRHEDFPLWTPETEEEIRSAAEEAGGSQDMVRSLKAVATEHMLRAQITSALIGSYMLKRVASNPSLQLSLASGELDQMRHTFPAASIVARASLKRVLGRELPPKHRHRILLEASETIGSTIKPYRTADMPQTAFKAWDEQCDFLRVIDSAIAQWPVTEKEVADYEKLAGAKAAEVKAEQNIQTAERAKAAYLKLEEPFTPPSMKSLRKTPYWQFMQAITGHPPRGSVCPQIKPLPDMAQAQQIVGMLEGLQDVLRKHTDTETAALVVQGIVDDQTRYATTFNAHRAAGSMLSQISSLAERMTWLRDHSSVLFDIQRQVGLPLLSASDLERLISSFKEQKR